uniref:Nose resistant-to-fluoxetine protein N-terminal domain-containing protein n=1 Tax=Timema cristinae TaxID=61476 RepID=A0A7R9CVD1_TIMCR|nr:unnamed protein product [Timema cristinae]
MDIFSFSPVFAPTSVKVQTENCRRHSQIFLHQLKKYKLWALQMYDSSAKLPSGVLRGNVNQLGDFDQCLSVTGSEPSTPMDLIRGQYCLASIDISATPHAMSGKESLETPVHWAQSMELFKSSRLDPGHFVPQFSTIMWGLCVPHSCTPNDVDASLKNALSHFGTSHMGLQIETLVDSDMCYHDQPTELSVKTVIVISMFFAVISVALIATLRDDGTAVQLKSRGKLEKTLMAFSIKKTLSELLRVEQGDGDIKCINGIRALCTLALYVAHKFMSMTLIPYSNRINLAQLVQNPVSMLIRAFAIYVYAFLLLSGVLTAYNMSREMKRKGYIDWKRRYLGRFIRLTPALISMVVFYAYIWEHLGNGPMWNKVVKKNADLCKVSMWKNMLYVQNFYPIEEMCATHTHQLSLDMQLSLVAPLLVYLLFVSQGWGILLLAMLQVISIALRYYVIVQNNISLLVYSGMTLVEYHYHYKLCFKSIKQAPASVTTWIKAEIGKICFNVDTGVASMYYNTPYQHLVYGGWLSTAYLIYLCFFSMSEVVSPEYQYDTVKMSIYYALSPVALSLALSWVILACVTGHGGWLNSALCWRGLTIFSKISYSVYLTQFLVFFYNVGTTKTSQEIQRLHHLCKTLQKG